MVEKFRSSVGLMKKKKGRKRQKRQIRGVNKNDTEKVQSVEVDISNGGWR